MERQTDGVDRALRFNEETVIELRRQWVWLMDVCVWGELQSQKIGAVPRLRKRLLETGEAMKSLFASRDWIPKPREQLKNALASAIKLRDALAALQRASDLLSSGEDYAEFTQRLLTFHTDLIHLLETRESEWAELLENQNRDEE